MSFWLCLVSGLLGWLLLLMVLVKSSYLSAHYIRVYVERFVADLDRAKGGRKTCSLSQLAAYMLGERIALKG